MSGESSTRAGFARALLEFYDRQRRDLPWRRRPSPYRTLVSELMLQQTGVSTVIPYFERFTARFPDLASLARAEEAEVLALWSGLGYYTRGRNLHRTARLVVQEHAGALPETEESLRRLPGLGPYTAAAVAAIGFGIPTLAVDGNAARVLARLFGVSEPIDQAAVRGRLRVRGEALVPDQRCGDFVQAIMEMGALVCLPAAPRCEQCPVTSWCVAYRVGTQRDLPRRSPRAVKRKVALVCVAVERGGRLLMVLRPPGTLLGGTWTMPGDELRPDEEISAAVARALAGRGVVPVGGVQVVGSIRHIFTHRDVTAQVVRQRVRGRPAGSVQWVDAQAMAQLALSRFTRKTLELLAPPSWPASER